MSAVNKDFFWLAVDAHGRDISDVDQLFSRMTSRGLGFANDDFPRHSAGVKQALETFVQRDGGAERSVQKAPYAHRGSDTSFTEVVSLMGVGLTSPLPAHGAGSSTPVVPLEKMLAGSEHVVDAIEEYFEISPEAAMVSSSQESNVNVEDTTDQTNEPGSRQPALAVRRVAEEPVYLEVLAGSGAGGYTILPPSPTTTSTSSTTVDPNAYNPDIEFLGIDPNGSPSDPNAYNPNTEFLGLDATGGVIQPEPKPAPPPEQEEGINWRREIILGSASAVRDTVFTAVEKLAPVADDISLKAAGFVGKAGGALLSIVLGGAAIHNASDENKERVIAGVVASTVAAAGMSTLVVVGTTLAITGGVAGAVLAAPVAIPLAFVAAVAGGFAGAAAGNFYENNWDAIKGGLDSLASSIGTAASFGGLFGPVVVDLDGDGVELVGLEDSSVFFDTDQDGLLEQVGWVGADDGLLVVDLGAGGIGDNVGDGVIDQAAELSFMLHDTNATTDMDGLRRAFDTNKDGVLDAQDAQWSALRIWNDADQDGVTDAGELKTLAELGIESMNLSGSAPTTSTSSNTVHEVVTVNKTGGQTSTAADVAFNFENSDLTRGADAAPGVAQYFNVDGDSIVAIEDAAGVNLNLDAVNTGVAMGGVGADTIAVGGQTASMISAGDGNDTVVGGTGSDFVRGGEGNDVISGNDGTDFLMGGAGADDLRGGAGNDTLFIDADDVFVDGGTGTDTVYVETDAGVTLDLSAANIEKAIGRKGNDVFSASGSAGVVLAGGAGDDNLNGGAGADTFEGGAGNDTIVGGSGRDIATFMGLSGDYQITTVNGVTTIVDMDTVWAGDEGTDTISGVEKIWFSDQVLHLDGMNNIPIASDESFSVRSGQTLTLSTYDLVKNDDDFDGDLLSILSVGRVTNGSISLGVDGGILFTPDASYAGPVSFEYTVADGQGGTATATATINVTQPLPSDDLFQYQWGLGGVAVSCGKNG